MSHSSTEAKNVTPSKACQVVAWLRQVLKELGIYENQLGSHGVTRVQYVGTKEGQLSTLAEGNTSNLRYHYVIRKVQEGSINLEKVSTEHMEADF